MTTPLLEAALDLARSGFAVLPCKPREKTPLTRNGFKDATCNEVQVRAWWSKWPDANIGIATGCPSGIIVVDVDGPEGEATLRGLEERFGPLPATTVVATGKGRHLYFVLPEGVGRVPSSQGGGVDIRGDGGYVIAPPSVHPSGTVYAWDEATPEDFADAPEALIAFAKDRKLLSPGESPIAARTLRPVSVDLRSPMPWLS